MSFQWSLIAGFLYVEIGLVSLLLLPLISAQRWQKIFKSRFLRGLGQQVHIYFYVVLVLLVLCLLDAIREMNKYSENEGSKSQNQHQHLEQELRNHMVLFRAQRNFYITGFSLFLVFVIRRLMTLLNSISSLTATSEANLRQAESASRVAQEFLSKQDSQNGDKEKTELEEKIEKKDEELCNAKKDLSKALRETEAMKSQAEAVAREYDRLMEEHANLQKQLAMMERDGKSDKKDD